MVRKHLRWILLFLVLSGCGGHAPRQYRNMQTERDTLYQVSTINALFEGIYDGVTPIATLRTHGDVGIGTFNHLDGEMVVLDGQVYQVRADGKVYPVSDTVHTPFAAVTYFDSDQVVPLHKIGSYKELQRILDEALPSKNLFYAVRIDGTFSYVKTRSVPAQTKPYLRLVDVARNQPEFEFNDVAGTLVGFRCPAFVKGVNVPGWHLHFLTDDRTGGGHLLEVRGAALSARIDKTRHFRLHLPENDAFASTDIAKDLQQELKEVE